MKKIVLLCISLFLTGQLFAEFVSEKAFTQQYHERLTQEFPEAKFKVVEPLLLETDDFGGYELSLSIANMYDLYRSGNYELDDLFAQHLLSMQEKTKALENTSAETLLPVIKPKTYLDGVSEQIQIPLSNKEKFPFYFEELNQDLHLLYAFDSPNSLRFASHEDIKKLSQQDIKELATKNILQHYRTTEAQMQELDTNGNGRIFIFSADETYEASMLFVDKFHGLVKEYVDNEPIVFIPARDVFLFVDSKDKAAYKLAKELAAISYQETGYTISPHGYIKGNKGWERFE